MLRKYLLRGVLLCSAIGAIAWLLTRPPLPLTSSPQLNETFWRAESPATLALFYKQWASIAGWELLAEQAGNTYFFSAPLQRIEGRSWPCLTLNDLKITLTPSQGGTLVRMLVTGERLSGCADSSP
jgi:hypothetical protein